MWLKRLSIRKAYLMYLKEFFCPVSKNTGYVARHAWSYLCEGKVLTNVTFLNRVGRCQKLSVKVKGLFNLKKCRFTVNTGRYLCVLRCLFLYIALQNL